MPIIIIARLLSVTLMSDRLITSHQCCGIALIMQQFLISQLGFTFQMQCKELEHLSFFYLKDRIYFS